MVACAHALQGKLENEKILERAFEKNQVTQCGVCWVLHSLGFGACTGLWVGSGGPLSRGWGGQSPGHTTQETLPEPPLLCLLPSWWTTLVCTFYFFAQIFFFTQKLSKSFYVLYTLTSLTTQSKRQTTLLSHTLLILSKHAGSNTCAHPLSLSYVNLCSMRAVPGTRCYITTVVVDNDPIPRSISIPTYV